MTEPTMRVVAADTVVPWEVATSPAKIQEQA